MVPRLGRSPERSKTMLRWPFHLIAASFDLALATNDWQTGRHQKDA
jgi:hypothetical protein